MKCVILSLNTEHPRHNGQTISRNHPLQLIYVAQQGLGTPSVWYLSCYWTALGSFATLKRGIFMNERKIERGNISPTDVDGGRVGDENPLFRLGRVPRLRLDYNKQAFQPQYGCFVI